MTYTRTINGQKYRYKSYRKNGEVKTKYLGREQTFYDKEMYVFPILFTFLLALFYSLFMDMFKGNWLAWAITLVIMTTLYYYNLKWAKKIVYEGK